MPINGHYHSVKSLGKKMVKFDSPGDKLFGDYTPNKQQSGPV